MGLSGGVDSALCARLARDALGAAAVLGVALPDEGPSKDSVEEAIAYARSIGIAARTVPVGPIVDAVRAQLPTLTDPIDVGNATARVRMIVLYAIAREAGWRVLGTGNKSEILLGYFTKYGDGGVDLSPIGDLYKTEVWELAERLGLPESIRTRVPTAGFWLGQTDEAELGLPVLGGGPDPPGVRRASVRGGDRAGHRDLSGDRRGPTAADRDPPPQAPNPTDPQAFATDGRDRLAGLTSQRSPDRCSTPTEIRPVR